MESGFVVLTLLVAIAFYIFIFWLVIRAVRALEKIADRVNRIANNENTRE